MPKYHYAAIIFQVRSGAFADDAALTVALKTVTGKDDLVVKRKNYDDGSWSGWFSVAPGGPDAMEMGRKIEKIDGVNSVMLRTNSNDIVPLHATPSFPTGAIIDRKPPRI